MMRNALLSVFLIPVLSLSAWAQATQAETKTATYLKAKTLIIAEINFENLNLSEALDFFASESSSQDPAKKGLNFVLKKPLDPSLKEPLLNLNLKKTPLSDVLRFISAMTNYQVKYEENAIVLTPPDPVKKP